MIKNAMIAAVVLVILLSAVLLVFSNYVKDSSLNISSNNDTCPHTIVNLSQGNSSTTTGMPNNKVAQNNSNNSNKSGKSKPTAPNNQYKVSSAEAKSIAQKNIGEPGASAGTPRLSKVGGKYMYIVPVLKNGRTIGSISVDPQTGDTGMA